MKPVTRRDMEIAHPWVTWQTFVYREFPSHVNMRVEAGCYAWKPIIIRIVAHDIPGFVVVWVDSGARLVGGLSALDDIFHQTEANGFYTASTHPSVGSWVYPATLKHLWPNHPPEILGNMMGCATVMGLPSDSLLVDEFADCAMKSECICPKGSSRKNHRQDQSVLTVLIYKIFGSDVKFAPREGG